MNLVVTHALNYKEVVTLGLFENYSCVVSGISANRHEVSARQNK